jgi:PAS domain S-box-containing protein
MNHPTSDPRTGEEAPPPRRAFGRSDSAAELHHVVKFYASDALLCDAAADFVCAALKAGEPTLLIVTPEHDRALRERIAARGYDFGRALRNGMLLLADAHEMLGRVLVNGVPDRRLFFDVIGGALEKLAQNGRHKRVRAFGELVDMMWRDGQASAALGLEELWSELHAHHSFALFCAYLLGNFFKAETSGDFGAVDDEIGLHRQVELALRHALREQRIAQGELQTITDALPVLVSFIDSELRFRFVNRAYEVWRDCPREKIIGCHVEEIVGAEPYARQRERLAAALKGSTLSYQIEEKDRLGLTRHFDVTLIPQRDEEGRVTGVVSLVSDYTRQKQLERARAKSEEQSERLLKITAAIAEAITPEQVFEAVVDETGAALGASSAALWLIPEDGSTTRLMRANGYSAAQLVRFDGVPVDSPHRFPALDAFRDGNAVFIDSQGELLAKYPAVAAAVDTRRRYSLAALPLRAQNRVLGVLAFTFEDGLPLDDERRSFMLLVARHSAQAMERLRLLEGERESKARAELLFALARACIEAKSLPEIFDAALSALQQALSATRCAILTYDEDGVMRFKRWRGLSDIYRSAVEGHSPWKRDVVDPQPLVVTDAANDRSWEAYWPLFEREGIGALAFFPLVASGKLLGKFMVYYDRPRVLLPQHLDVAGAIANHVAAAAARFSAMRELEQTVRFNEMFTAILGHDLRNPLGAIMAAGQLVKKRTAEEKIVRPLDRILNSGARMERMIDQLLDFTRVRVGHGIPLRPQAMDLVPVLKHVLDELDLANQHPRLRLEVSGDTKGRWDPDRLGQVFSNLVGNALEHGDVQRGVHVLVDGTAPDTVRVRVHNMGAVAPEMIPSMFDPMSGGGPRRARSQGLGLGLFITQELARAHGGSIGVESSEAAGTTFTVLLPRIVT